MTAEQRAIAVEWLRQEAIRSYFLLPEERAAFTVALGTCGNCEHSNDVESPEGFVYCTLVSGFYCAKTMQTTARCERWEAQA